MKEHATKEKAHRFGFWGGVIGTAAFGPGVWITDALLGIKEEFDWNEYLAIASFIVVLGSLLFEPKKAHGYPVQ